MGKSMQNLHECLRYRLRLLLGFMPREAACAKPQSSGGNETFALLPEWRQWGEKLWGARECCISQYGVPILHVWGPWQSQVTDICLPVTIILCDKGQCDPLKHETWGSGSPGCGSCSETKKEPLILQVPHWARGGRECPGRTSGSGWISCGEQPGPDSKGGKEEDAEVIVSVWALRQVQRNLPPCPVYPALDLGWREGPVGVHVHLHCVVTRGQCGLNPVGQKMMLVSVACCWGCCCPSPNYWALPTCQLIFPHSNLIN